MGRSSGRNVTQLSVPAITLEMCTSSSRGCCAFARDAAAFIPSLTLPCEVVPAALRNDAGIIGAAGAGAELGQPEPTVA